MPARLLIINADDLGYEPAVTEGILQAMREGIVSSATFMVNTPFSADAADQSDELALGLHLNLARWRPQWRAFPPALLDESGELIEANADLLPPAVVEHEALAQLDRFRELLGAAPTHVDVHKHLHRHPTVLTGLLAAAKARRLPVRAIDPAMRSTIRSAGVPTTDHFIGDAGQEAYWTLERLEEHLSKLQPGTTELMCHPGYTPTKLKSGYAHQREVELQTFLDPKAREALAKAEVTLGTFTHLRTGTP